MIVRCLILTAAILCSQNKWTNNAINNYVMLTVLIKEIQIGMQYNIYNLAGKNK